MLSRRSFFGALIAAPLAPFVPASGAQLPTRTSVAESFRRLVRGNAGGTYVVSSINVEAAAAYFRDNQTEYLRAISNAVRRGLAADPRA